MKYQYNPQEPTFRIGDIAAECVSRQKNYAYSVRNGRKKHGFIYVVSGKIHCSFQNCAIDGLDAGKGDLLFIPYGSIYISTYLEENTTTKIIQFNLISGSLPDYLSSPSKINLPNAGELVESCFHSVEHHTSYHPFYYLSCLYKLLWKIDESYTRIPAKYKKLQPALAELAEYYTQNEKISYYAELCDMSEVNFRRLLREYTGMSPIEYRNNLRLQNARTELQSGEYTVSEAAELCGFTNLSFFTRLYKKKFGHLPSKE